MFMDLGVGMIISLVLTYVYGVDLNLTNIVLGGIFAVLPDIDVPFELLSRGRLGGKDHGFHREYTHYPILYIPVCVLTLLLCGKYWGTLLSLCLLFHTMHDSVWMGWGLKLLWPFSKRTYKFFSDPIDGSWSWNPVSSWSEKELNVTMKKYGDDNWFRKYIRFSKPLVMEFLVFMFAVIFVFVQIVDR